MRLPWKNEEPKQPDEARRREELKKLFADPRFNTNDGLDVYVKDYSGTGEPPEQT